MGGVVIGTAVTAGYAASRDWPVSVPPWGLATAVLLTLLIGGLAGLHPATRAARVAPTAALAST